MNAYKLNMTINPRTNKNKIVVFGHIFNTFYQYKRLTCSNFTVLDHKELNSF